MKRLLLALLILGSFTGCGFFRKPPKLICHCDEGYLRDSIRKIFNADSVLLYSYLLQEELYMPEIRAIKVCVINGTTQTLDFKPLPEKYQRFDNYSQIEYGLKKDAEPVAKLLLEMCDTREFNDIIIEFIKYDKEGVPNYHFIAHYYELFEHGVYSETED